MMKNARRMLALAVALMLALSGLAMAEEGEWAVEAECAVEAPLAEELEEALDTEGVPVVNPDDPDLNAEGDMPESDPAAPEDSAALSDVLEAVAEANEGGTAQSNEGTATITVVVTGEGSVTVGDQTATASNPATVTASIGGTVKLSFTPETGKVVKSVVREHTYISGTTQTNSLAIINNEYSYSVMNDIMPGSTVSFTVTFGTALAGGADKASAMALKDDTVTDLAGGWYRVDRNIEFNQTINLLGETHLVIDSGKTMTVNVSSGDGIQSVYPFTVSGEGTLSVSALDNFGILVSSYSQTGATVSVSAKYSGIRCYAEGVANNCVISGGRLTTSDKVLNGLVDADNDIIILGGQIDQTGTGIGLNSTYGSIILGCSSADDYIRVHSYRWSVRIADWQTLTDGTDDYTGVITDTSKLIGKRLRLKDQYTITVAENIAHGSVAIASVNGAERATTAHYLDTVALAVTPGTNSELDSVYYRQTQGGDEAIRTITPVDGVYSFTMPACDVTVGAVFRYVPPAPPAPVYTMSLAAYSFPFTGEAIEPAVTVRRYGTALPEDAYTVSYRDNVGVGTATVTVTDASVFRLSTSFQITENAVENPEITYDPASGAVGVRDGERTIPADAYEVKREDQDGRVSVTVTARERSGYRFTATRTFEKRAIPTGILLATLKHKGKTRLDLTWTAAKGVDGCDVFFGPYPGEPAITEANQATGLSLTGLVAGQEYRAVVKAYVMVDGEKVYFAESPAAHAFASGSGKKRTNPKAVRLDKASRKFTLQVGKGKTLKASVTRVSGSKKLLTRNGRLRYVSDDPGVATVNAKGRVTAVAAGTCTIYVLTANGLRAEAKVTVK